MRRSPGRLFAIVAATASVSVLAGTAGAAPAAVDLALNIGASTRNDRPTLNPNGSTVNVTNRQFYVFVDVSLITAAPGRAKARLELGGGLRWGADDPDPGDQCTSTPTTGECNTGDLQPIAGSTTVGWFFDVTAPATGTYTFRAELAELGDTDPDPTNNASSIIIVVSEPTGDAGGSGGGGGGGSASISTSAVKISPTRPKAGSTVVAAVRVAKGGSAVRPTGVTCTASLGKTSVKGAGKAASGVASCLFRTPKSAKSKMLRGSVSFSAGGTAFTKRFATRLG